MAKYIKKPIVIEAVQLRWDTWGEICDFIGEDFVSKGFTGCYIDEDGKVSDDASNKAIGIKIPTLEGEMLGVENDYIIKGIAGEFYPCKPDIFYKLYDLVE